MKHSCFCLCRTIRQQVQREQVVNSNRLGVGGDRGHWVDCRSSSRTHANSDTAPVCWPVLCATCPRTAPGSHLSANKPFQSKATKCWNNSTFCNPYSGLQVYDFFLINSPVECLITQGSEINILGTFQNGNHPHPAPKLFLPLHRCLGCVRDYWSWV